MVKFKNGQICWKNSAWFPTSDFTSEQRILQISSRSTRCKSQKWNPRSGTILNFPNKFAYFCVLYYYPFENFFDMLKIAQLRSYGQIEAGNMAISNIQKMTKFTKKFLEIFKNFSRKQHGSPRKKLHLVTSFWGKLPQIGHNSLTKQF